MEKIADPVLIIVPDDPKLLPFIHELLVSRGLPVSDWCGTLPYELENMNPSAWREHGWLAVDLTTRRRFSAVPIILDWAEKAQIGIYLCGYMYGEELPGNRTTRIAKAGTPLFWEGLARAQWWFEKEVA